MGVGACNLLPACEGLHASVCVVGGGNWLPVHVRLHASVCGGAVKGDLMSSPLYAGHVHEWGGQLATCACEGAQIIVKEP